MAHERSNMRKLSTATNLAIIATITVYGSVAYCQQALQISSPLDGAIVTIGENVPIIVSVGPNAELAGGTALRFVQSGGNE
jgi:hypothetical protein